MLVFLLTKEKLWKKRSEMSLSGNYFNRSINTPVGYRIAFRFQLVIAAFLYGILSSEMDDISTLLSLLMAMPANFY